MTSDIDFSKENGHQAIGIRERLIDYQQHTYSLKGAVTDLVDWFGMPNNDAQDCVRRWKKSFWYTKKLTEL